MSAAARDPTPSAPRGHGPLAKTCSLSCSSSLHPLRSWSLRQTRGGSTPTFVLPSCGGVDSHWTPGRELIPCPTVEDAAGALLVHTTPLLEMESYLRGETLISN